MARLTPAMKKRIWDIRVSFDDEVDAAHFILDSMFPEIEEEICKYLNRVWGKAVSYDTVRQKVYSIVKRLLPTEANKDFPLLQQIACQKYAEEALNLLDSRSFDPSLDY